MAPLLEEIHPAPHFCITSRLKRCTHAALGDCGPAWQSSLVDDDPPETPGSDVRGGAGGDSAVAAPAPVTAPTKHTDYPYHPPRIDDVMYQAVVPPFVPPPPGDPRVGVSLPSVLTHVGAAVWRSLMAGHARARCPAVLAPPHSALRPKQAHVDLHDLPVQCQCRWSVVGRGPAPANRPVRPCLVAFVESWLLFLPH